MGISDKRQQSKKMSKMPIADFCQSIIGEAPIGIFQSTCEGRFLNANTAMAKMLGFSSAKELIDSVSDIASQMFVIPEKRSELIRRVSESLTFHREEVQYRRKNGSQLIANLYIRARRDKCNNITFLEGFVEDISERKQAEQALQQSEQKYRELVENANSIILRWTREGIVNFLNEYGLRFFGYKENEIIGHSVIGTIVPETETTGRDLRELMKDVLAYPEDFEHNVNENIRRNGERVWIDWTNKIVLDDQGNIKEILSIGSDITERRHTEEALKESEALFRSLADNANAIIGILQGGKLVYVNPYFAQISGYSQQELHGLDFFQILAPQDREMVMSRAKLRQLGETSIPSRYEARIITKDGSERHLDFAPALIEYKKEPAIIGIAYDITERKKTERELHQYREHLEELVTERTTDLEHANERLRELDRLKSLFIASMSHELRTPLNSIIGFTGMTMQGLSGELNEEQHDNLMRVYQSAKHLLSLITDVIDISKIEAGKIDTFPTFFSIRDLIQEAVLCISPQAQEKCLPVSVEVPEDIELYLDRKRLLQCLLNLLSNAVKFTESGSIAITARIIENQINISVADTGIGIAEDDISKLFSAFERLETHLRVKAGGTGLGLYLTRKIVTDLFHGQVLLQSQMGIGSTFTLVLPLEEERNEDGAGDRR